MLMPEAISRAMRGAADEYLEAFDGTQEPQIFQPGLTAAVSASRDADLELRRKSLAVI